MPVFLIRETDDSYGIGGDGVRLNYDSIDLGAHITEEQAIAGAMAYLGSHGLPYQSEIPIISYADYANGVRPAPPERRAIPHIMRDSNNYCFLVTTNSLDDDDGGFDCEYSGDTNDQTTDEQAQIAAKVTLGLPANDPDLPILDEQTSDWLRGNAQPDEHGFTYPFIAHHRADFGSISGQAAALILGRDQISENTWRRHDNHAWLGNNSIQADAKRQLHLPPEAPDLPVLTSEQIRGILDRQTIEDGSIHPLVENAPGGVHADPAAAERLNVWGDIARAIEASGGLPTTLRELVRPAIAHIGDGWYGIGPDTVVMESGHLSRYIGSHATLESAQEHLPGAEVWTLEELAEWKRRQSMPVMPPAPTLHPVEVPAPVWQIPFIIKYPSDRCYRVTSADMVGRHTGDKISTQRGEFVGSEAYTRVLHPTLPVWTPEELEFIWPQGRNYVPPRPVVPLIPCILDYQSSVDPNVHTYLLARQPSEARTGALGLHATTLAIAQENAKTNLGRSANSPDLPVMTQTQLEEALRRQPVAAAPVTVQTDLMRKLGKNLGWLILNAPSDPNIRGEILKKCGVWAGPEVPDSELAEYVCKALGAVIAAAPSRPVVVRQQEFEIEASYEETESGRVRFSRTVTRSGSMTLTAEEIREILAESSDSGEAYDKLVEMLEEYGRGNFDTTDYGDEDYGDEDTTDSECGNFDHGNLRRVFDNFLSENPELDPEYDAPEEEPEEEEEDNEYENDGVDPDGEMERVDFRGTPT